MIQDGLAVSAGVGEVGADEARQVGARLRQLTEWRVIRALGTDQLSTMQRAAEGLEQLADLRAEVERLRDRLAMREAELGLRPDPRLPEVRQADLAHLMRRPAGPFRVNGLCGGCGQKVCVCDTRELEVGQTYWTRGGARVQYVGPAEHDGQETLHFRRVSGAGIRDLYWLPGALAEHLAPAEG